MLIHTEEPAKTIGNHKIIHQKVVLFNSIKELWTQGNLKELNSRGQASPRVTEERCSVFGFTCWGWR